VFCPPKPPHLSGRDIQNVERMPHTEGELEMLCAVLRELLPQKILFCFYRIIDQQYFAEIRRNLFVNSPHGIDKIARSWYDNIL
jgi:hypothetical protein